MISFSAARSASVTRSMSPLFDTCSARPKRSARMPPASRAVWIAKLSNRLLFVVDYFLMGLTGYITNSQPANKAQWKSLRLTQGFVALCYPPKDFQIRLGFRGVRSNETTDFSFPLCDYFICSCRVCICLGRRRPPDSRQNCFTADQATHDPKDRADS